MCVFILLIISTDGFQRSTAYRDDHRGDNDDDG